MGRGLVIPHASGDVSADGIRDLAPPPPEEGEEEKEEGKHQPVMTVWIVSN